MYLGNNKNLKIEDIINKEIEGKQLEQLQKYKKRILDSEIESKLKRRLEAPSLMRRLKNPLERLKRIKIEDYSHEVLKNFHRQRTVYSHQIPFEQEETIEVYHVIFDKSSEYVLTGASDGLVKVYNRESGYLLKTLKGHLLDITILTLSNCNRYIASASKNGHVRIWSFPECRCLAVLREFEGKEIISLVFNKELNDENGQCYLVITAPSMGIFVFKEQDLVENKGVLNPQQVKFNLTEHIKFNRAKVEFYFSEMSKSGLFAAYGSSGYIHIWPKVWDMMQLTPRERTAIKVFPGLKMQNKRSTISLDWSDDSRFLVNYTEIQVMIVELKEEGPRTFTTKAVGSFEAKMSIHHRRRVQKSSIAVINNHYFAIGFNLRSNSQVDDTILLANIYLYDLHLKKVIHIIKPESTKVIMDTNITGMCFHPTFKSILATSDQEGQVILWDCTLGLPIRVFYERGVHLKQPLWNAHVWDCCFSSCGKYLGVSTNFGSFSIYGYGATMTGLPVEQFFEKDSTKVFLEESTFAVLEQNGKNVNNARPGDKDYGVSGMGKRCNSVFFCYDDFPKVEKPHLNDMKKSPWKYRRKSNDNLPQPDLISIHSHSYANKKGEITKKAQFKWLHDQEWANMNSLAPFKNHDMLCTQEETVHKKFFKSNKKSHIEKVKDLYKAKIDNVNEEEVGENLFEMDNMTENSGFETMFANRAVTRRRPPVYNNENYEDFLAEASSEEFDEGEEVKEQDLSSHDSSEEGDDMGFIVDSSERNVRRSRRLRNRRGVVRVPEREDTIRRVRTRRRARLQNETLLRRRRRQDLFYSDEESEEGNYYDNTVKKLKVREAEEIQGDIPCSRCNNLGARISCDGDDCNKMFHSECSKLRGAKKSRKFYCIECLNLKYSEKKESDLNLSVENLDAGWAFEDFEDFDLICPQVGDTYYFISRAYEKFVTKFHEILAFKESNFIWVSDQLSHSAELENGIKCKVISIDYEWPRVRNRQVLKNLENYLTVIANITLEVTIGGSEVESEFKDTTFTVKYFPTPATDPFLINAEMYENKFEEYKKVGVYSQINVSDQDGNQSTYHIEKKMANEDENYFKCIKAQMMAEDSGMATRRRGRHDQDDYEYFSFWEVEYPVIDIYEIKKRKGKLQKDFYSFFPLKDASRQVLVDSLKQFTEEHQEEFYEFVLPVDLEVYNDYLLFVGNQMNIERICRRIKYKCYRSKEAILGDVLMIEKNCFKYNQMDSQISQKASLLVQILTRFLEILFEEIEQIENPKEEMEENNPNDSLSMIQDEELDEEEIDEMKKSALSKVNLDKQIQQLLIDIHDYRVKLSKDQRLALDLDLSGKKKKKRKDSIEVVDSGEFLSRKKRNKRVRSRTREYSDYYGRNYKQRERRKRDIQFIKSSSEEETQKTKPRLRRNRRGRRRATKKYIEMDEDFDYEEDNEVMEVASAESEEFVMQIKKPARVSRRERMEKRRSNMASRTGRAKKMSFDDESFEVHDKKDEFVVDDYEEEPQDTSYGVRTRNRRQRRKRY